MTIRSPIVVYAIVGFILNILVSTIINYCLFKIDAPQTTLPIAIVNFAEIGRTEVGDVTQLTLNFQRTQTVIAQLSEAGFIVLDAQSVLSAPSEHYVSPELLYDAPILEGK